MRGEYTASSCTSSLFTGSPPHAWGIPQAKYDGLGKSRITPTCVGNTAYHKGYKSLFWDHPHMRGEYL